MTRYRLRSALMCGFAIVYLTLLLAVYLASVRLAAVCVLCFAVLGSLVLLLLPSRGHELCAWCGDPVAVPGSLCGPCQATCNQLW